MQFSLYFIFHSSFPQVILERLYPFLLIRISEFLMGLKLSANSRVALSSFEILFLLSSLSLFWFKIIRLPISGIRNSGSQISASFTSDGRHIISASEDSNVYIWNNYSPVAPVPHQAKSIQSCERFPCNAVVAIPWSGMKSETLASNEQVSWDSIGNSENVCHCRRDPSHDSLISFSSQNSFSLSHEFFSEALPRGSATWPEEKLPASSSLSPASAIRKSQYRRLKSSCQSRAASHAWGLMIVTAGWDGRIRLFHNYGLPVRL